MTNVDWSFANTTHTPTANGPTRAKTEKVTS